MNFSKAVTYSNQRGDWETNIRSMNFFSGLRGPFHSLATIQTIQLLICLLKYAQNSFSSTSENDHFSLTLFASVVAGPLPSSPIDSRVRRPSLASSLDPLNLGVPLKLGATRNQLKSQSIFKLRNKNPPFPSLHSSFVVALVRMHVTRIPSRMDCALVHRQRGSGTRMQSLVVVHDRY